MKKLIFAQPPQDQAPEAPAEEQSIEIIKSGLTDAEEEQMYLKFKNEGKCCEGGSEGWTG